MTAYYNENGPFAAAWLRALIDAGQIAPGDVDDRSITDVQPDDVRGYTQVHLFAGIGGWSYALRLAGWPDDRPVWTGSCPCQPFSVAGRRAGADDPRHIWPEFRRLAAECRPSVAFGEQVAGRPGRAWLAAVRADLEELGYAVGAADLCAAGVGAPHIRQRLYWVADSSGSGLARRSEQHARGERQAAERGGDAGRLADPRRLSVRGGGPGTIAGAPVGVQGAGWERERVRVDVGAGGAVVDRLEHAASNGRSERGTESGGRRIVGGCGDGGELDHWRDVEWLPCRDGTARPAQPGIRPLAHGVPGRVGRLRGYGNAIVPQVAAAFVTAYMRSVL